jgi:ABC-type transport system involved in multi-copper enzyme maturation permease subunit
LALQVGLVALLAVLILVRWPTDALVDLSGQQAQQVLRIFGYGILGAVVLLAPVFPATSIVRERREGTLSLLLNSPMSPPSIVLGKLVGVLGFSMLLVLLSLPAAAACYTMGGVGRGQLLTVYLVLVLVIIQYASLGLLISSFASTVDSALRLTYGAILLLLVVSLGPYQFFHGKPMLPGWIEQSIDWIRCISPIPAMMYALGQSNAGARGLQESGDAALRYGLISVLSSAGFIAWTIVRINQRMLDKPHAAGIVTDELSAGEQAWRRLMYLWFFDPQRRSGLIGPLTNPVMIKEFRTRKFGRSYWMMRLVGACLVLSLLLMLATARGAISWGASAMSGIVVLLQVALLILLAPSLASGMISSERESGGWQLLQMTPLSSFTIVLGKLMSVAWTLLLILLATLPAYGMMWFIEYVEVSKVPPVLITLFLTAGFALLLSAAVSSLFRRTAGSTTVAYALLVGLCGGTMLIWLGRGAPFTHHAVETVLKANPLAAALSLLDAPGFGQYHLVPANWWFLGVASVVCLLVLAVQTWRLTRPQ